MDRPAWSLLVPGPAQLARVTSVDPYLLDVTELHVDLTRRVLAARAHRAETGVWPTPHAPNTESLCPGRRWVYESRPDGSLSISLEPPIRPSTSNGADRFPLSFELRAAP
ncbi:MAG: hypothetical protein IPK07_07225 [Deltaproteobacteria bacterium]|nr:hypothetical protein [Deltaproteobacteria bacterium]